LCWAPGPLLAIAEGVEDGLAYRILSGVPTWAALSAGNMAALVLPERFTEVHVVADRDDNGTGQKNAAVLVRRLRREGRKAHLIEPVGLKDANDVLRSLRAAR
jgi:putative DNA primase/helicase